jgi:hypothetical protein
MWLSFFGRCFFWIIWIIILLPQSKKVNKQIIDNRKPINPRIGKFFKNSIVAIFFGAISIWFFWIII